MIQFANICELHHVNVMRGSTCVRIVPDLNNAADHNGTALGHIVGLYSSLLQVHCRSFTVAAGRFSYDQMLDPKGNTAVYVLYAYARIAGVLRRAEHDVSSLSASDLSLTEPSVF